MNLNLIKNYVVSGKRAHLVGIAGVSMLALAKVLKDMGLKVSGSDQQEGSGVDELRELGIDVAIGHSPENLGKAEFVIRTAAAQDDNAEIIEAHRRGLPVFERAQAWGFIMAAYPNALCISGTHGKTTTTSMSTQILLEAGKDPTVMIGAHFPLLGASHRVGDGDTIVLESCEYRNSFLNFTPTIAVILNVDRDHLDFFKDIDDISASFRRFAELVPDTGAVIGNYDDAQTMKTLVGIERRLITFGFGAGADVHGENLELGTQTTFDIAYQGKPYAHITLRVPGRHNAENALAAAATAIALNIPSEFVEKALAEFTGAGRRLEYKGSYNGADIYDDYAHHPNEIKALFNAVEAMGYERFICVFQPHTYSRTRALFDDFVRELSRPDLTILAEIYAAREVNRIGISSADIAEKLPSALFFNELGDIAPQLQKIARPGDIIITVGAGNIYKAGEDLLSLSKRI